MSTTRRRSSSTRRTASRRIVPLRNGVLVRLPRVRTAKQRIESGNYDRSDVRDRLASAVLRVILRD